ncbi:mtDNA inheritance protein dml1 [Delitschia confertaspora ATCC 74209]|uniref:MtDNA inheritance protein dml1 n=1 Tax=Delitschia confertaspora ATCC 74209 TaxID=1513339 RepID=A0A9P4MTZ8_9PLEO|nr:mtDNA inheritance protein dml1 [Delitschia confertaspora ATCC 74209]
MHEIVTLQFGQQSNFLGTHFWNTQESYFTYPPEEESPVNHDILFRPGVAPDGSETFTPRTLIYDLKGSFGSMRRVNALYEPENNDPQESNVWSSKPSVTHFSTPIKPSDYQTHLDSGLQPPPLTTSSVRYWSDYSRLYYHPKSLVQLSEFDVNDTLMPFEKWDVGMELFEKLEREVDLVDRDLRPFVEECDNIQGLQIMTGVDDAWGGWASGWLERLRDEYGKLSIWTWGLGDQGGNMEVLRDKRLQQIANSARSLQVIGEQSSVYVPISSAPFKAPPYLSMDHSSHWHRGALQAIALESMILPSRLRSSNSGNGTLQDLEETINSTGNRRIAKLQMSIANPDLLEEKSNVKTAQAEKAGAKYRKLNGKSHDDDDDEELPEFDMDVFTIDYKIDSRKAQKREHIFGRAETYRGEWDISKNSERDPHDRFSQRPAVQRYSAPLLFPVLDSFPSIFNVSSSFTTNHPKKLAVYAGLSTSTSVANQIRTLDQIVRRMVNLEERETLSNGLQGMAEEYDEGWDSGSDSDSDE